MVITKKILTILFFTLMIIIPFCLILIIHLQNGGARDRTRGGGDRTRGGGDRTRGGGDRDRGGGDRDRGGGDRDRTAIDGVVNRQNCYRKAAGLGELKVDPVLQKRSQAWVDYLAQNESCTMRHPGTTGNLSECGQYLNGSCQDVISDGQNIAWRQSSQAIDMSGPSAFNWAVDGWYDECQGYKDYGWDKNPGNNPETGHYTQLMWKNATRIGCGAANCGPNTILVNCNYGADNNRDGGAGNLNPPREGGRFPQSIVPIKCGINCDKSE